MFAKIVVLACAFAVANAGIIGAPAAYTSYAAPAVASYAAPAVASYAAPAYSSYATPTLTATSDNVYRSAGNLQTVSQYSKSIATPYSSSNKHDIRITNPGVYAQTAYAAPVATYAHAAPVATYAHAAPVATYAHAAPVATYAHAAPVATYAAAAPIAHAAPAVAHGSSLLGVAYSPAVAVSHMSYSSPIGVNYSW